MIRNLRDKLNAISVNKPPPKPVETACLVRDTAAPLSDYPGLLEVGNWHARLLGGPDVPFDPRRALFLDTETTGLGGAGTVAFLVGAGFVQGERFVVRQLLMRDYPQERSLLTLLAELMADYDWVVSFNGKSFDMPLLRGRFTLQRMDEAWRDLCQLDLLHPARRTWKLRLDRCNLQRLEQELLGLIRTDDLPGAEVPRRFFDYLKVGDMGLLEDVLRHNLQDIRTLALLLTRLAQCHERAEEQESLLDVFSLGRSLHKAGEIARARRCFQVASVGKLASQARLQLAASYRRTREVEAEQAVYEQMTLYGEGGAEPYVRLAMLAEHRHKDPRKALSYTRQAMLAADPAQMPELERRRARLTRKIERGSTDGIDW